jgi:CRISPR-associated protein Cas5t
MICLRVEAPFGSFRKSYARSLAETYPFPPPATIYGMLLSLVGEYFRSRHAGVRIACAYAHRPRIATTLRKLSRFKYGVPAKQDYVETLCGIDFLCWVDSSSESQSLNETQSIPLTLEERIVQALQTPEVVTRTGVVCLGLSDDAVDSIAIQSEINGTWHWLNQDSSGDIELPVWVDHVGSIDTRWQRFRFEEQASAIEEVTDDKFISIVDPRPAVTIKRALK